MRTFTRNFLRSGLIVLAYTLACVWPMVAAAQTVDETITVCNDCNTGFQYRDAAAQAAQFEFPNGWVPESDDVYVVNFPARQTLAYQVTRTLIDPDPFVIGDETIELMVLPIEGEPGLMFDLAEAGNGIQDFYDAVIQDVPAEELDLPFDSALDLVGGGFGDANRIRLQQAMEDLFNTTFSQFAVHFNNLARMAGDFFGVSTSFPSPGNGIVRVNFPDGTTLRVSVETSPDPTDSGVDLEFDVDVDMESIRGPNGEFIPLEDAHLSGFSFMTSDADLNQSLLDLLNRLGVELVFGGGSSGGDCSTTCTMDDGVWKCTIVSC